MHECEAIEVIEVMEAEEQQAPVQTAGAEVSHAHQ